MKIYELMKLIKYRKKKKKKKNGTEEGNISRQVVGR